MDLSFLYDKQGKKGLQAYEKVRLVLRLSTSRVWIAQRSFWFEWLRLRRRKPDSEEEIDEIRDLIFNVYESMDDQARAVLLSLSKIVHSDDASSAIEEKIYAIIAMGHSLCCSTNYPLPGDT